MTGQQQLAAGALIPKYATCKRVGGVLGASWRRLWVFSGVLRTSWGCLRASYKRLGVQSRRCTRLPGNPPGSLNGLVILGSEGSQGVTQALGEASQGRRAVRDPAVLRLLAQVPKGKKSEDRLRRGSLPVFGLGGVWRAGSREARRAPFSKGHLQDGRIACRPCGLDSFLGGFPGKKMKIAGVQGPCRS